MVIITSIIIVTIFVITIVVIISCYNITKNIKGLLNAFIYLLSFVRTTIIVVVVYYISSSFLGGVG